MIFFGETWWHHMGWQLLPKHLLTSQRNALESFWIHAELHPESNWHLEEISEKGEQDRHDDQESDVEEIVVEATQTKQYQCEPISTNQPWGPCILLFEFQELVVTIVYTIMQIFVRKLDESCKFYYCGAFPASWSWWWWRWCSQNKSILFWRKWRHSWKPASGGEPTCCEGKSGAGRFCISRGHSCRVWQRPALFVDYWVYGKAL